MNLQRVVDRLKNHPAYIKMGKGALSRKFKCSPEDIVKARKILKTQPKLKVPKILIFDVETSPMKAYIWKRWKENISLDQTISEWFMICWSAKWLYSTDIISSTLTEKEILREDDSRIVKELWKLINESDIIVAYNGKKADVKWMNTRFIVNGLYPPKPYYIIDPCEVARKQFKFSSNKLDALAGYFNIEHKMETSFELWKECLNGNKEALYYMEKYNKVDVEILEEIYLKLRPWIIGHPNIGNFLEDKSPCCSVCGSNEVEEIEGEYYYTSVGKYSIYRCKHCKAVSRGRVNLNTTKTKTLSVGK